MRAEGSQRYPSYVLLVVAAESTLDALQAQHDALAEE